MTFDITRERLRERLTEPRDDYGLGECGTCGATLTQTDIDNDRTCTNCGSQMDSDDEDCYR